MEIQRMEGRRVEPDARIDELAHTVIGAAIEVHRVLGPGYLESVYEESLCIEFGLRGLPYERQRTFAVDYKGRAVGAGRLDLVVGGLLLVEIKSVEVFAPIHHATVISYLKANRLLLGLLINFNVTVLREGIKRIILS
jgi:GxxExxY protein